MVLSRACQSTSTALNRKNTGSQCNDAVVSLRLSDSPGPGLGIRFQRRSLALPNPLNLHVLEIRESQLRDDGPHHIIDEGPAADIGSQEVHTAIASRYDHVVSQGLAKERRADLCKRNPFPAYLPLFKASTLNCHAGARLSALGKSFSSLLTIS